MRPPPASRAAALRPGGRALQPPTARGRRAAPAGPGGSGPPGFRPAGLGLCTRWSRAFPPPTSTLTPRSRGADAGTRHPPGRESCSHPSARGPTDPPVSPGSVPLPPPLPSAPARGDCPQGSCPSRPGLGSNPELARRLRALSLGLPRPPHVPGPRSAAGRRPGRCGRPGGEMGCGARPPRAAPLGRPRPLAVASRRPSRLRPRPPLFLGLLPAAAAAAAARPPRSAGLTTAETAGPTRPHSGPSPSPSPSPAGERSGLRRLPLVQPAGPRDRTGCYYPTGSTKLDILLG